MHLSNKQQRQLVRLIHLVIGSALGFLVYAPTSLTEGLRLVMQVVPLSIAVFSLLCISRVARHWLPLLVCSTHLARTGYEISILQGPSPRSSGNAEGCIILYTSLVSFR